MTVKEKLATIIRELPDEIAVQIYNFALFLREGRLEEQEMEELTRSPAFSRLAERALNEIDNGETLTVDELKEEISS